MNYPHELDQLRAWTGPLSTDWECPVTEKVKPGTPWQRWPYGPPYFHQVCCSLHHGYGYCDCTASDQGEEETPQPPPLRKEP